MLGCIRSATAAVCSTFLIVLAVLVTAPSDASAQGFFKRGDSTGDGKMDLSDPIRTLGFLFLGDPVSLDCQDASDANDDGKLDLTDAVFTLGFLFLGGPPPEAPFPGCGADPTADSLTCASYLACPPILLRASKSSTIDISSDDRWVVMANPDDDSVSVFDTTDNSRTARLPTGHEPGAVVIHPDSKTVFVANRAEATVVRIGGIDTANPAITGQLDVGSEPTGLALSPTGARLFVAEFAEGRVSVIDTSTMKLVDSIDAPLHPRAIAVTNNGDASDDDELLIVPEYFGEPVAGGEATDTGRTGRVRIYSLKDLSPTPPIIFAPIDSGFVPDGSPDGTPTVMTSPNQLYSVAVDQGKIYVTSVSASPAPPVKFNGNVMPVVYVGDLDSRTEDRSSAGTNNLARKVADKLGPDTTRFFLADLVDISFFGNAGVAYALSRGGDVLQRLVYSPVTGLSIGSDRNVQIDLGTVPPGSTLPCQNPSGVVTAHLGARAYINCWVNRQLGVVDFSVQALTATVESSPPPAPGAETSVKNGKRFFFTGRARWSREAWSSCGSCHPDGLSDGITWSFAAGPRQTTSMDGTFSHGAGDQKQRVLNWTAIFDELHDFERNTRGVSGGLGAITTSPSGKCGTLSEEVQDPATAALPGNLAQPIKELQDRPENCRKDWDDIEAFVRTIRPPRALRFLDAASVARGAVLFGEPTATGNNGGCVRCHGGPGWTVSRRFWTPSTDTNDKLTKAPFVKPPFWPLTWNIHAFQIEPQPAAADNTGDLVPPAEVSCVIRNIGTFGVPGNPTGTDALEKKDSGKRAEGAGGFNVPSLYGLALGSPYLHHGQVKTLDELFSDPLWATHLTAGNPNFLLSGDVEQQRKDLTSFLLSIDASTPEQPIPAGWDGCPAVFPE